jgi:hypothetical protein
MTVDATKVLACKSICLTVYAKTTHKTLNRRWKMVPLGLGFESASTDDLSV